MRLSMDLSDRAILKELGSRLARHRLNRNVTQAALAVQAGVSTPTVQRIEQGSSTQVANLLRILRALKLLDNLEALIPEPAVSPIQQARLRGKLRRRASSLPAGIREPAPEWRWEDDA